jgi:hypothetical protein
MPGESFVENHVEFERKWFRFCKLMWILLLCLLAASVTGLSGGGGPLAKRTSRREGLEATWERIVRARSQARVAFTIEAPSGAAQLTISGGMVESSVLRDITPQPKSVIAGRDSLTLVYDVEPGSAATVRMTQAIESPGVLRSRVESGNASLNLEQIVLP